MIHIVHDHDVQHAGIGTLIVIASKWIAEISPILGLLAAIGGLVVIVLSIKEKMKKNKLLDLQIQQEEEKLDDE